MFAKFSDVNLGLHSRIYQKFVFRDYSITDLGEIFNMKAKQKGFNMGKVDVCQILALHTWNEQRQ